MFTKALAWTLIHFLWQGVLIGLLLMIALMFTPTHDDAKASSYRYVASLSALLLLLLMPLLTLLHQLLGLLPQALPAQRTAGGEVVFAAVNAVNLDVSPNLLNLMLIIWAAGVSWFALRMLVGWLALQYLQRTSVHATPQWVEQQMAQMIEQMSIRRPVRIIVSGILVTPMTLGWIRPVIILPLALLTGMQCEQLRLLLAHELAHIRRHDYLVNMFQNTVRIFLFYHPVVHWVCGILEEERELCCDHMAMRYSTSKLQYAKALISLQEQPPLQPALSAAGSGRHSLLRRIRRILGESSVLQQSNLRQRPLLCLLSLGISMSILFTGVIGIDSSTAALHLEAPDAQRALILPARDQFANRLDELAHYASNYSQINNIEPDVAPGIESQPDNLALAEPVAAADQPPVTAIEDQSVDPEAIAAVNLSALSQHLNSLVQRNISAIDMQPRQDLVAVAEPVRNTSFALQTELQPGFNALPEPVYMVKPKIPVRMIDDYGIQIVDLVYSVGRSGKPVDITIGDQLANKVFIDAAVEALQQWRYPPVSAQLQELRIRQQFVFIKPESNVRRCTTGTRICGRDYHHVEYVIVNSSD